MTLGTFTSDLIDLILETGHVREGLTKEEELGEYDWPPLDQFNPVRPFLKRRYQDGFRIALVETFSHERGGSHIELSKEVNAALFAALDERFPAYSILAAPNVSDTSTGAYLATSALSGGEVRINLFFVKPPDEDCE